MDTINSKEDTKKIKYSFKKSEGTSSPEFVRSWNFKGKIDYDYCISSLLYYAINDEEYHTLKIQLDYENDLLINTYLKDIISTYPILINNTQKKENINLFINSDNYDSIIDSIIQIIFTLDETEFPLITRLLYNTIKDEYSTRDPEKFIYNTLKNKLNFTIKFNHNLKHVFKIESSKKADYILRKHQYWSKSESHHESHSRKWRSRRETNRRRKERRDTKDLCKNN